MEICINDSNFQDFLNDPSVSEFRAKGALPRDYTIAPVGGHRAAPEFPDALLLDDKTINERIAELTAKKALLSDVRNVMGPNGGRIPSLDQHQYGYCATADTEVLTERGWVAYPDYNWADPIATVSPLTHRMEFQTPFQRHVYEYDGPMIYSTNRRLDFGVTPDHEMYVRKWNEAKRTLDDHYSFVRARDLGWYSGMLAAPSGWRGTDLVELEVPDDRRYDGDDFLALLGLVVSDGYAGGTENTRNWVSFASFREETRPAILALAARTGFHESPSRRGVFVRYDAGALAEWLRATAYVSQALGAENKRVPALVKVASERQIKHFLHWFDDRTRNGVQFYSNSKRLIDDLQELHLRIGRRSTIAPTPAKETELDGKVIRSSGGYCLTVSQEDALSIDRKKHIETERYKGLVYCAGVPNHTLLTRRNGSVLVSSNCWAHSSVNGAHILRAMNGQVYIPLSAFAVAAIIKNYRDQGGWGHESLDFIASVGVPTQDFWPQNVVKRSLDTPEMRANAALHKITEWYDLSDDPDKAAHQMASCILGGYGPVVTDFNWWGHSVLTIDILSWNPLKTRILNSWSDSWSENGTGLLEGNKAKPNGAVGPRVTGLATV